MAAPTLISYAYLNEISGGDQDFQKEIVDTFLQEMVGEMDRMKAALGAKDWQLLGNVAHKVKAPIWYAVHRCDEGFRVEGGEKCQSGSEPRRSTHAGGAATQLPK